MTNRMNRAGVALKVGEELRKLAKRLAGIDEYSGSARERELSQIHAAIDPLIYQLTQLGDNARAARGSYPNYPSLRKAILAAGEEVYEIRRQLEVTCSGLAVLLNDANSTDFSEYVVMLADYGQRLKLLEWMPPEKKEPVAQ